MDAHNINMIQLTLFLIAMVFFALAMIGVPSPPRLHLLSTGLFFLTMALGHYRVFIMHGR